MAWLDYLMKPGSIMLTDHYVSGSVRLKDQFSFVELGAFLE